ncbi:MAG: TPR REGION protein, partial [Candidatus Rokubacteria bacterium]|nr:TPR REGION protein [Candidatus Rokubacteria bacterium]
MDTTLSRLGAAHGACLVIAALVSLLGCASKQDEEVRKLQARATYEQAVRNLSENRLALGMAALKEALQLDPDNVQYHNTLGVVLLNLGRPV